MSEPWSLPSRTDAHYIDRGLITIGDSQSLLASDRPTVVMGYVVNLTSALVAPGMTIYIIADTFGGNGSLDVSGLARDPSKLSGQFSRAPDGETPGAPGHDPDPWLAQHNMSPAAGGDAGNIFVVCRTLIGTPTLIANGGNGQNGLNGGNGATGATRGPGLNGQLSAAAARGGLGGQGGQPGRGGTAGRGGNAGRIFVSALDGNYPIRCISNGGQPGAPGAIGRPGDGGKGGSGGTWGHIVSPPRGNGPRQPI